MVRGSLIFALLLASATTAKAQTWPICFEDGAILTPDGYRALPEAYAAFSEIPFMWASATLFRQADYSEHDPVAVERVRVALLEAIRAGFSPDLTILTPYEATTDCLSIVVTRENKPAMAQPWHYYGVYFDVGSAVVDERWSMRLRIVAARYRPGLRVILDGHTDTVGSPEDNMALSRRRVDAVADALIRLGVPHEDIETSAHGETRLAQPSADETSEPLNRRVWIDVRGRPR